MAENCPRVLETTSEDGRDEEDVEEDEEGKRKDERSRSRRPASPVELKGGIHQHREVLGGAHEDIEEKIEETCERLGKRRETCRA